MRPLHLLHSRSMFIKVFGGFTLFFLFVLFLLLSLAQFETIGNAQYIEKASTSLPSETSVINGSYTGTIAINEPLALGVLDISLIITEANDSLTGILNDSSSLAFSHAAALTGNITSRTATSATFTLASAPSTSMVTGRQVTRAFTINGSVHENGDIILGGYEEQITGFTPHTLIAQGMFLASRPRVAVVPSTLSDSSDNSFQYLPLISNNKSSTTIGNPPVTPTPSHSIYLPNVER